MKTQLELRILVKLALALTGKNKSALAKELGTTAAHISYMLTRGQTVSAERFQKLLTVLDNELAWALPNGAPHNMALEFALTFAALLFCPEEEDVGLLPDDFEEEFGQVVNYLKRVKKHRDSGSKKILMTSRYRFIENELWFICPQCDTPHIQAGFQFCPMCGVELGW